ncbi:MAG: hypothetical protein A2Z99_21260 [Treponema sp. GWB1_62_6]|nr:MAG: hypothetical protein A2Y36_09025 [Treponema sp. GWA1_62_8]OHE68375.1 MAG: hypothetical protein A2001_06245 [Treponema sp. GWC1_61_84]OHE71264.1 MAG: hypothetical protein A2413_19605 [Treponema sp. RIFOXYC1_FULL_61_9]OHE71723.1 MAG: hypothetical protein A2Z99_21260 [Treponema sp. GWB1_62_6]HCM28777.1 hypothetical protein [Treponema sp.]
MNQSLRIAARNAGRQKKRSFLLGGAVAFGFLVITLVNGFTAGIVSTVKENFSYAFGGHLYFSGAVVSDRGSEIALIEDDSAAVAAIAALGKVAAVHRRSHGTGSLYFGTAEESQRIVGVDFSDESDFREKLEINSGSLADLEKPGSLVLPDETARKLGVGLGETLIFKVPTVTGQQNVGEFVLIATTPGGGLGIGSGYTGKAALNELIGLERDGFQTINVHLSDVAGTAAAAELAQAELARRGPVEPRDEGGDVSSNMHQMRRMIGMGGVNSVDAEERWEGTKFTLTTIEDAMAPVLSLVKALDAVSFGVFIVLMLIIMVGILNSYRMVMIERSAEIGTMRAIGVQKSGIRDIFLWEALTVSAAGAAAGFLLALSVIALASLADFSGASFFTLFLSKGRLVFLVAPLASLRNFLILCSMSLAAVYLPARAASRLEPAQALRSSY